MKSQIWAVDKNLPVFQVQTMEQVIDSSTSQRRFESFVLGMFAGLALILASVGLYGVLASLVLQRRNEIGIRIALGAESKHVMRLVLGEGFQMVALGLLIGIAGGIALTRLLASLFFGISPTRIVHSIGGRTTAISAVSHSTSRWTRAATCFINWLRARTF